jgi:hypothetical protein
MTLRTHAHRALEAGGFVVGGRCPPAIGIP